jgi:5'-3' exonuclease
MRTLNSLSIVDLNSILVRIYKGAPKDAEPGFVETSTLGELALVRQSCEHTIVCLDRPPYFRSALYPAYKGSREPDEVLNQIKRHVRKALDLQGYVVAQADGFEADDLLATLAKAYYDVCPDIRLITSDKDCAQLLNDRVRGFDAKTGNLKDVQWCYQKFGVEPKDMALYQALVGDSSDEYKGIPSWGAKQASQAIQKCGDLAGIRKALAKQIETSEDTLKPLPNVWVKFAEHQGELETYLQLATLRTDAPLDAEALIDPKGKPFDAESVVKAVELDTQNAPKPEDLAEETEVMTADKVWTNPLFRAARERAIEAAAREGREAIAEGRINHLGKETPEGPRATMPPRQQAMHDAEKDDTDKNAKGLALLRKPFPEHQVGKLPKGTKTQNECPAGEKRDCAVCGGWHHPRVVHLDYVGHAALTNRLLDADPTWDWRPLALTPEGLPKFDASGGLWIKLTVCGVSRLGYGHAETKGHMDAGAREKVVVGDALRNAAMRFGAALDLWSKQDLAVVVDS